MQFVDCCNTSKLKYGSLACYGHDEELVTLSLEERGMKFEIAVYQKKKNLK